MKTPSLPRTLALLAITLLFAIFSARASAAPGDVDLSFDPGSGVDGTVDALVAQPDGKIIICGQFTTVRGLLRPNLARLNADGSGDSSFNPGTDFADHRITARCLALQPDGKLLVGGDEFSDNANAAIVVRLNPDGSRDGSFGPVYGYDSSFAAVTSLFLQPDGKLIIGGSFLGIQLQPSPYIARINPNGTLDTGFVPVVPSAYGSAPPRGLQPDGKVLVQAHMTGTFSSRLLRLEANGNFDPSFGADLGDFAEVHSVVGQPDGKLLVAGNFRVNGQAVSIARFKSNGTPDPTFGVVIDNSGAGLIRGISLQPDGQMIVAGSFYLLNGSTRNNLARLKSDGTLDPTFPNGTDVAGGWTSVNTIARQTNGQLLIAGTNVARLNPDGSADLAFDPGHELGDVPQAMVIAPDGKVLVAGAHITRVNANGSPDSSFNPGAGPDREVAALALQSDGKLLIGGSFTSVSGNNRDALARLNPDGSLDGSFNSPLAALVPFDPVPPNQGYSGFYSRGVTAIVVQADGRIVVAGYTFTYGMGPTWDIATARSFLFRFHADGTLDSSFAGGLGNQGDGFSNFAPTALAMQPDGKFIVCGAPDFAFNVANDKPIARLNFDGTRDTGFQPDVLPSALIYAVALQPDGKLLLAGESFGYVNGGYRSGVTRLNANGSSDTAFNPGSGPENSVFDVAVQPDGKVLAAGAFTTFNGIPRQRIARLNANGGIDSGFQAEPGGQINTLALQADGRILIGGDFLTVDGYLSPSIARLEGGSVPPGPNTAPVVTLLGSSPLIFEAAANYTDPGATAFDSESGSLAPTITCNNVLPNVPGNYAVTWTATDSLGATSSATRAVTVRDTTAPSIGGTFAPLRLKARQALPDYRPQAVVSDIVGVTSVTQSPPPGARVFGPTMTVTITARDAANNASSVSFTVKVTGR